MVAHGELTTHVDRVVAEDHQCRSPSAVDDSEGDDDEVEDQPGVKFARDQPANGERRPRRRGRRGGRRRRGNGPEDGLAGSISLMNSGPTLGLRKPPTFAAADLRRQLVRALPHRRCSHSAQAEVTHADVKHEPSRNTLRIRAPHEAVALAPSVPAPVGCTKPRSDAEQDKAPRDVARPFARRSASEAIQQPASQAAPAPAGSRQRATCARASPPPSERRTGRRRRRQRSAQSRLVVTPLRRWQRVIRVHIWNIQKSRPAKPGGFRLYGSLPPTADRIFA